MKYPKYIKLDNYENCCMILKKDANSKYYYYGDGGRWSLNFKEKNGDLFITTPNHLRSIKLIEISEECWRESNGSYLNER